MLESTPENQSVLGWKGVSPALLFLLALSPEGFAVHPVTKLLLSTPGCPPAGWERS